MNTYRGRHVSSSPWNPASSSSFRRGRHQVRNRHRRRWLIILILLIRIWFLRRKMNKQIETLDEYEEVLKKHGLLVDGELIDREPMEQIHAKK